MARFSLSSHPWELISVHNVHNSTVSKQLRYSLTQESVYQPVSRDKAPCTVAECRLIGVQCRNSMKKYKYEKKKNYDDKELPLCYNQLKALYFCKRHHITIFYRCTQLWRGQTTSHHSTKDMEVFDALITNQQQENWNAVCRQNAENVVKRRMNCIQCDNHNVNI